MSRSHWFIHKMWLQDVSLCLSMIIDSWHYGRHWFWFCKTGCKVTFTWNCEDHHLLLICVQLYSPRENKTFTFVIFWIQKILRVDQFHWLLWFASPSIRLVKSMYVYNQSATSLISNNNIHVSKCFYKN